ncbi:MAG: 23S rRNA (adenine(2030)-N(6))-methyltransferase RlmJ [Rhodoferax sp.]|nr:23S rRNA (adenine(2030)-N(6))-methyltransferase RlmJ [Rhodoferax sp.]
MFSYRHAFHAANHADVLKHLVLLAVVRHLTQKDAALQVFDTHAGAGLYLLDGDYAKTSAEASQGFLKLVARQPQAPIPIAPPLPFASAIQDYIDMVASFNTAGNWGIYPGSPFIIQRYLHGRDKLKLFETHPTDSKTLAANIAQLEAGRRVTVLREDGFEGLRKFLPPPARRALVLCDPSYELKSDYARVQAMVADAMQRFSTGTYAVWYPIIPRPEAHDVPRKLKTLATKAGKNWLGVSLTVKNSKLSHGAQGELVRPGLPASGMFLINPPHTLKALLKDAMPQLVQVLGQDQHAAFTLESGG